MSSKDLLFGDEGMIQMRKRPEWLCVLLLAVLGCGGGELVPVKGVVTVDGKPLAGATVQLIPDSPAGKQALGTTDAQGRFQLSTNQPRDGALRGTYKVTVQLPPQVEASAPAATQDEAQSASPAGRSLKRPAIVLPAKYSQPDQTVLRHKVPEDGDLKLELQSMK